MNPTVWWQGRVECPICGYGTAGHAVPHVVSVIEIERGRDGPIVPLQCPECDHFTLGPVDVEEEAPR